MQDNFHKPFLKSLVFIACVTLFAMFSIHYIATNYIKYESKDAQILIYTASESQNSTN